MRAPKMLLLSLLSREAFYYSCYLPVQRLTHCQAHLTYTTVWS